MPVDQLPPSRTGPRSGGAKLVEYGKYVDQQIDSTRRTIKAVDFAAVLGTMFVGMLGFLLVAAVVDHWLVPGGLSVAMRYVLFAVMMAGLGYYALRRLVPLCFQRINPAYAAQTIERSSPSLKNSLLNLLLFRTHRDEIPEAVYHTLEEQAAQGLTQVPVDSAVDRTYLVRLGWVLCAVAAVAAMYLWLSPKDPLVAAERVLMPWADLVPASRVSIDDIEPGTATVALGQFVEISANVRRLADDEAVMLRYTTEDQQAIDRAIPMTAGREGLRFTCRLPEGSPTEMLGIAQNVRYWIEAGDARSLTYAIDVVPAPTIFVNRIEYDYPSYTGYRDHAVENLGDIRAIEGTKITIHARANGPIEEAHVDFEADGRRDLQMTIDGNEAVATFTLALRKDRLTPRHTSYVLQFTNTEGRENLDPVKHAIDVLADSSPEVSILEPQAPLLDVRLDETVEIEIEARDPDFALSRVRLQGEVDGRTVVDQPLLEVEHTGRYTGRYRFTPSEHSLRAGDVVRYWAQAEDNRTPDANVAISTRQSLRIVAPEPEPAANEDQSADREPGGRQPGDENEPGEDGQQPDQGGEPGDQGQQDQNGRGTQDDGQPGAGQQQPGEGEQGDSDQDSSQDGMPGANRGDQGEPGEDSSQSGGQESEAGEQSQDPQDGEPSGNGPADRPSDRSQQEQDSPVSPDGDDDGEAFRRIREFLDRQRESGDQNQEGKQEGQENDQRQPGESQTEDDQTGQAERPSDQSSDERREAAEDSDQFSDREGEPSDQPGQSEPQDGNAEGSERDAEDGGQTSSDGQSGGGQQPSEDRVDRSGQPEGEPEESWEQRPSDDNESGEAGDESRGAGGREDQSAGEAGGDQPEGIEDRSKQKSPHDGTGSDGENQSADEGVGESSERGTGRDSPDGGTDAESPERTGQPGSEQQGQGTEQRDGEGQEPGGAAGDQSAESGEPTNERPEDVREGQPSTTDDPTGDAQPSADSQSGAPTADGGSQGTDPNGVAGTGDGAPEGDDANLDYAREQTDLVLEKLIDMLQEKRLDPEMLEELGWSEEEVSRFVDRWQQRKQAAETDDPAADGARRELEDALRSLGLQPGELQQQSGPKDNLRDLREGYRGPVPLEYQERLRAYNEGVSRADRDD